MSGVPAGELLRVDVERAVSSLGDELAHGPWQVPVELVRLVLRRGAEEVRLEIGRRGFRLVVAQPLALGEELRWTAAALDRSLDGHRRAAAVSRLEAAGGLALLWAARVPRAQLLVESADGGWHSRRDGGIDPLASGPGPPGGGLRIAVVAPRWPADRARTALTAGCRFAPAPVWLDGVPLPRGFRRAGLALRLERPRPAALLVGSEIEAPILWLLQHGVVSARATVPRYPPFEAAVELGDLVPDPTSPAALRGALTPFLRELVERAAAAMLRGLDRPQSPAAEVRDRLVAALLVAARRGVLAERIAGAELLQWVAAGRARRVSPAWLASRAAAEGGRVAVAEPGVGARVAVPHLELAAACRPDLAAVTGAELRSVSPLSLRRPRWHSWWRRLRDAAAEIQARLPARPLPHTELSPVERDLLAALGDARSVVGGVELYPGRGGRRRSRGGALLLPRRDPVVQAAAAAVAADPRWLPVAVSALLDSATPTAGAGSSPPA